MKRFLIGATAGIALAAALIPATGGAYAAAKKPAAAPACAVKFIIGKQTCYVPAQVRLAEKKAPWAVNPTAAVSLTFGSALSQVSVIRLPGGKDTQIEYLYGPLRHDYGRQNRFPVAIRIIESNQRTKVSTFKPAWTQQVCGQKVEISPAADPNRPHPAYGPWYLIANFPHGNRSLGIVANSDKTLLTTLACRLIQNQ